MACGGELFITLNCDYCGEVKKVNICCNDRTCPECRKREFIRLKKKYMPRMALLNPKKLVFVTLTQPAGFGDLRHYLKNMQGWFRKLVRHKLFKGILQGGYYSIETVWTDKGGWYVHLHAIAEVVEGARVLSHKLWMKRKRRRELTATIQGDKITVNAATFARHWLKLTGCACWVDLKPVIEVWKDGRQVMGVMSVMSYILKYMNKPASVGGRVFEYNQAHKGIKVVHSFGSWHPNSKVYRFAEVPVEEKLPVVCKSCGNTSWLSEFEQRAAAAAFEKLKVKGKKPEDYVYSFRDRMLLSCKILALAGVEDKKPVKVVNFSQIMLFKAA